jgi:hypothetical protein
VPPPSDKTERGRRKENNEEIAWRFGFFFVTLQRFVVHHTSRHSGKTSDAARADGTFDYVGKQQTKQHSTLFAIKPSIYK